MNLLHERIATRVDAWRAEGYPCAEYPAIAEILGHAIDDERTGQLRYLRKAQFRALEVYWSLRLVEGTPKIPNLYARCFPKQAERREALGLSAKAFEDADYDFDALFARIIRRSMGWSSPPTLRSGTARCRRMDLGADAAWNPSPSATWTATT